MKILYVARKNLGDNLFMTPVFEHLAKRYDIVYLGAKELFPLLREYNFFKKFIPGCEYPFDATATLNPESIQEILSEFDPKELAYMMYDSDESIAFLNNHPELKHIKTHSSVLNDVEVLKLVNDTEGVAILGESRKVFLKLQLMTLDEMEGFDFKIRLPYNVSKNDSDKVVIYQGSRDKLRKLSDDVVLEFARQIPDAVFLITKTAANLIDRNKIKINYVLTDPYTQEGLANIIKIFRSKPKAMIGPDSGLTQLALAHGIMQIWLQSKIRPENVIDPCYFDKIKLYLKRNSACQQDCVGCAIRREMGPELCHPPFVLKNQFTHHAELACKYEKITACLDYSPEEVSEIISMINSI